MDKNGFIKQTNELYALIYVYRNQNNTFYLKKTPQNNFLLSKLTCIIIFLELLLASFKITYNNK